MTGDTAGGRAGGRADGPADGTGGSGSHEVSGEQGGALAHEEAVEQRDAALTLKEERLQVGTETVQAGRVRAVKHVDTETVEQRVPREVERADLERAEVREGDSGQVETLPDGSLSIPVFEEQIVVEKRRVLRERVIVRKSTVVEEQVVTADLRRERVEIETEGDVRVTEVDRTRQG